VSFFGGAKLPWTSEEVSKMNNMGKAPEVKASERGVAGKKLTQAELDQRKSNLFKPVVTKKAEPEAAPVAAEAKKKKFGFF